MCFLALIFQACESKPKQETMTQTPVPPKAKIVPIELSEHGTKRIDNYFWLRDDSRKNQEVIDYLNAENQYLDTVLAHTKTFQQSLFAEMKGRIKEKDESVPYFSNGYWYYSRFDEGKEYPIYCRKKDKLENTEEILHDANVAAEGKKYYNAMGLSVSDDNQTLAYGEDVVSRRLYTLKFKNLKTNELYPEQITNIGSLAWAADNKTVFYTKKDTVTLLDTWVYRHVLGTDPKTDVLVYEEKDNTFYMGVGRLKSKKYISIYLGSTLTSEVLLLPAATPTGKFTPFLPRERGHEYGVEHIGNKFLIKTNWEAQNFRLMEVEEGKTIDKKNWKEVIPHRTDVYLDDFEVFTEHLAVAERKEGLLQIRIIKADQSEHFLDFGEPAYDAYISTNPEQKTAKIRYNYTSMTTPNSTFEYDMNTKEKKLLKEQAVLGNFDKNNYQTERLWANATDGTKVPISVVYRKDKFKKDASNPLLVYAYGSYGISSDPSFSSNRLSLLDRGFVFAIAHIRGGQEMGRAWYENGKLLKKKNTFTDFADVTKFLVAQKYGDPKKVFAQGGSAGGLLMGAVSNMNPELYLGMIAQVPFVDVISTMWDETIPLTTGEFDEWGNPKQKEYYDYMLSYSPYDQVKAQNYPNMLVTTGFHDSQVQYFEPAKWVAKLRAMKTDQNKLLFKTNMEAGHGGASGRFKYLEEIALNYAFMFDLVGITQ